MTTDVCRLLVHRGVPKKKESGPDSKQMTTTTPSDFDDLAAKHSLNVNRPIANNVVKGCLVPLRTKAEVASRDETSTCLSSRPLMARPVLCVTRE